MTVLAYNTWNPIFQAEVLDGVIPSEVFLSRTLEFTYTDRLTQYDFIEWKLDNRDGLLSRPEMLAAGLLIRIRLGYNGAEMPWRTFIINRAKGGLGVFGRSNPAVGSAESVITFEGRNRNAAGGKGGRSQKTSWSKTAHVPPKKQKIYGPTMTGQTDLMTGKRLKPRIIEARTLTDGIREIARRSGFEGPFALIEDCEEELESRRLVIPESWTDGQFLAAEAQRRKWVFKIDGDYLHFHSVGWPEANFDVVDSLVYGSGPDILELTIDADFQLPLPRSIRVQGMNPKTRQLITYDATAAQLQGSATLSVAHLKNLEHPAREPQVKQDLIFSTIATNLKELKKQAIDAFIARHMRAFQINLTCVGNPRLLAGRLLDLSGVGNPFVDNRWCIKEARHRIRPGSSGLVYITETHLGPPPKKAGPGNVKAFTVTDSAANQAQGTAKLTRGYIRGLTPTVGAVRRK